MVHTYNAVLLSQEKNRTMPFAATWVQLEIIILSEVIRKERDKYHVPFFIYGFLNVTQMNLSMKQNHEQREQIDVCKGGRVWGRV